MTKKMTVKIRVEDEFFSDVEDPQNQKNIKVLDDNWIQADSLNDLIDSEAFAYTLEVGEGISRKDIMGLLEETEVFKETNKGNGILEGEVYRLDLNSLPEYVLCFILWCFITEDEEDVAAFELYGEKL